MNYLVFLQSLRQSAPEWVNEAILFLSEMAGGAVAMAAIALIYWCINKRAGTSLLLNFSFAYMFNQILKNIFCVKRPFHRDTRLKPYTDATGYSFPSGHTMLGTSVYGTLALWLRKSLPAVVLCVLLTLLTAFGRNWIGVHTPQDVIVGMLASCAVIFANAYLLKWLDRHPKKDVFVFLAGLAVSLGVYFLIPGSEKVLGIFLGVLVGWIIERRFIRFEIAKSLLLRAAFFVSGALLLFVLYKFLLPAAFGSLGNTGKGLVYFFTFLYISCIWPLVMRLTAVLFEKKR